MLLRTTLRLSSPDYAKPIIALTGAGGKSTLLFRLGAELTAAGRQVLLTTTTRLWTRQVDQAPFALIAADPQVLAGELPTSLRGYRQVLAAAGPAAEPDKLAGLPPEVVCHLAALPDVGAVVVEADGSRERPLKAPAAHEPVVPPCATHVIVVAGMAAVGQPLDERSVHRPEIVAKLTGLRPSDLLTAEAAARLLIHPQGGLKGVPAGARVALYLNLAVDDASTAAEIRLAAARHIAYLVLHQPAETRFLTTSAEKLANVLDRAVKPGNSERRNPVSLTRYSAVLLGSARASEPVKEVHGRVVGVVLAAGQGTRLGGDIPKQLLPWGQGNTLVGHAVATALAASALSAVLVVTGYQADVVTAALADQPARCVFNPQWQCGQSSSVQAALAALAPDTAAVIFLLADQPDVTAEVIDALVETHRHSLAPIVAPIYADGQRGNPVLFDRSTFAELLTLRGDTGGRPLIERYGAAVQRVLIDQPQPTGIETWEDYQRRT
jgi:molybdenum cofactor cytidylyltransferase